MTEENIVSSVVGPHMRAISECIQAGFDFYLQDDNRHMHRATSRANLVHDYIQHELETYFEGVSGVQCIVSNNLFCINFNGLVVMRLKKLGYAYRASNHATLTSSLFEEPETQGGLFDSAILVTAGYIPNESFTSIREKVITRFVNNHVAWMIDIDSVIQDNVVDLPQKEVQTPGEKRRVRSRGATVTTGAKDEKGDTGQL